MYVLLHSVPPTLQQATAYPFLCWRLLHTHGQVGSVSCGVTTPLSWVLVHTRFCLCPARVCFPVPGKFYWLYGKVNGDLLQEGLCHTQVCCTQSSCPCGRPLLTHTSTGDTQTQFCLSLCGVSWHTQGLFEPRVSLTDMGFDSKRSFAPPASCWVFSFALA